MRFPIMLRKTHDRLMEDQAMILTGHLKVSEARGMSWKDRAKYLGRLVDELQQRAKAKRRACASRGKKAPAWAMKGEPCRR